MAKQTKKYAKFTFVASLLFTAQQGYVAYLVVSNQANYLALAAGIASGLLALAVTVSMFWKASK